VGAIREKGIDWITAVLVGGALLALAPSVAFATPPTNDAFANREVLSGPLPIELSRTNTGATKESGEFIPGLSPAGHSVWFEWEATGDDWITLGACDSDFPLTFAVFTGSSIDELTQAASGSSSEGPDCPYGQRQYTFRAQAGTKYEIAVDGNGFYMPPAEPPATEGTFSLRIEATPPPANDTFAHPTPLAGSIDEEPGGARFYFANATGNNWTATIESGEPFDGSGAGASVWYAWTPPESATYRLTGPCCVSGLRWSLYSGDSLAQLSPIVTGAGVAEVFVLGGITYRIAVFGDPDQGSGEPSMRSFNFMIAASLPPHGSTTSPSEAPAPQTDTAAPNTTISKQVLKRLPPIFVFRFHSSEAGSSFRCRLDEHRLARCGSSRRFGSKLAPGRHVLRVVAVDSAGNEDPTPAIARFRMPKAAG